VSASAERIVAQFSLAGAAEQASHFSEVDATTLWKEREPSVAPQQPIRAEPLSAESTALKARECLVLGGVISAGQSRW